MEEEGRRDSERWITTVPKVKKCKQFSLSGKGKETGSPLVPPEKNVAL